MNVLSIHEVQQDDLEHHSIRDKIEAGADGVFDDYHFNHLFGNRLRVVIPLGGNDGSHLNDNVVEKMFAKAGYRVDLQAGMAIGEVETERGRKTVKTKIGKLLKRLSKHDPEWRNVLHWYELRKDNTKKMGNPVGVSIVISRSPIDIIRMSDHDEWGSCHAPPGKRGHVSSYWPCAGQEARTGGAIAYVVRNADLQNIDDLQAADIFADDDRDVDGVKPLERLRLRRFKIFDHNGHDELDVLIPEDSTYGIRHVGFFEAVKKWAKEAQSKWIDFDNPPDWDSAKLHGGSYLDAEASDTWNKFFGTYVYGSKSSADSEEESQYSGMSASSIEQQANEQLAAHKYKMVSVNYEIEHDEEAYVYFWATVQFEYPADDFIRVPAESDFKDLWNYSFWDLRQNPGLKKSVPLGYYVLKKLNWINKETEHSVIESNGKVVFHFDVDNRPYSVDLDGFEHFLDVCDEIERNYYRDWNNLWKVLVKTGFMKDSRFIEKFQHFSMDEDLEWVKSDKIWIGDLDGVDSSKIVNNGGEISFVDAVNAIHSNALIIFPKSEWIQEDNLRFTVEGLRIGSTETPEGVIRGNYRIFLELLMGPVDMQKKIPFFQIIQHLDQYWPQYQNRAAQWWKVVKPVIMSNQSGRFADIKDIDRIKKHEPSNWQQLELPFKDWLILSELLPIYEHLIAETLGFGIS